MAGAPDLSKETAKQRFSKTFYAHQIPDKLGFST
jgi:hypothetical protein